MKNKFQLLCLLLLLVSKITFAQWTTASPLNTPNVFTGGSVGIGTLTPFSSTNNTGIHISLGGHSTLLLGDPVSSNYGGIIQTSDARHRVFIGANLYDDASMSWRNFQSGKGSAGISVLADHGGWGTGIDFYTSTIDNQITSRMLINGDGNVGIGTAAPSNKFHVAVASGNLNFDQAIKVQTNYADYSVGRGGGMIMQNADVITAGVFGIRQNNNWEGALTFYTHNITSGNSFGTSFTEKMRITSDGNVGIGTTTPGSFKLAVNGKIWTQEVNVAMTNPGPDYVFEKDYDLLSLSELETYINQNKHLPEVPSAKEMEANGLNLKEMNLLLLKKVEELTLHLIQKDKQIERLQNQNQNIEIRLQKIENQ